ncbi:MAG: hypothetical protein ABI481_06295 [Pyrinomonadaceae bacterium]
MAGLKSSRVRANARAATTRSGGFANCGVFGTCCLADGVVPVAVRSLISLIVVALLARGTRISGTLANVPTARRFWKT